MAPLRVSLQMNAPPEIVWDLISRFEHWPSWGVSIRTVEPSTGRVQPGLKGRVKTVAGLWLPFEITDVVDGESWHWTVAGVGATGHAVEPIGEGSRVTFSAPIWAPFYVPVLKRALRLIEQESAKH